MHDLHLLIAQYGLRPVFANVVIEQLGVHSCAFHADLSRALAGSDNLSPADVFALAVLVCLIADSIGSWPGGATGIR